MPYSSPFFPNTGACAAARVALETHTAPRATSWMRAAARTRPVRVIGYSGGVGQWQAENRTREGYSGESTRILADSSGPLSCLQVRRFRTQSSDIHA